MILTNCSILPHALQEELGRVDEVSKCEWESLTGQWPLVSGLLPDRLPLASPDEEKNEDRNEEHLSEEGGNFQCETHLSFSLRLSYLLSKVFEVHCVSGEHRVNMGSSRGSHLSRLRQPNTINKITLP